MLAVAKETRFKMLSTASTCYLRASGCEVEGGEEEWLHHYMMGKVLEKKRSHPCHYIEHYQQVSKIASLEVVFIDLV